MMVPKDVSTYCPTCRKHTAHKVKVSTSKAKVGRSLAWHNRAHARKLRGVHGKVKGKVQVKKQGIRNKLMLECTACKKKHERVIGTRSKKKAEVVR